MNPAQQVTTAFEHRFGERPLYVVRAPGRVNLIGEHTDYNDGFVLPMAIEQAIWLALRPREDGQVWVHSLDYGETAVFPLRHLQSGVPHWSEYLKGVAWALLEAGYRLNGWEGILAGDVPQGAGLSSSAALEMAAARAFQAVSGFSWDATYIARLAQRAENKWVGVQCGIMDQMICATGEAGHAVFIDCRSLATQSVPLPEKTAVLILDTGTRRGLMDSAYNERRAQCEAAAHFFGVPALRDVPMQVFQAREGELAPLIRRRARHVITENVRTLNAVTAMRHNDAVTLGRLMDESHASLRDDFEVSSVALDTMVTIVRRQPGCLGARMTGAGFGGCAIALVWQEKANEIAEVVMEKYKAKMDRETAVYTTTAAAGASLFSPK
ncbi:MAG: galactokinase [Chloroflexi bacterium]|nr:MAG: galactokinase [Chloroflexota bacterium]